MEKEIFMYMIFLLMDLIFLCNFFWIIYMFWYNGTIIIRFVCIFAIYIINR